MAKYFGVGALDMVGWTQEGLAKLAAKPDHTDPFWQDVARDMEEVITKMVLGVLPHRVQAAIEFGGHTTIILGQEVPEEIAGTRRTAATPLFILVTPMMTELMKHPDPTKTAMAEIIYVDEDGKPIQRN